jgi:hypothetical protein
MLVEKNLMCSLEDVFKLNNVNWQKLDVSIWDVVKLNNVGWQKLNVSV